VLKNRKKGWSVGGKCSNHGLRRAGKKKPFSESRRRKSGQGTPWERKTKRSVTRGRGTDGRPAKGVGGGGKRPAKRGKKKFCGRESP